jgi:hypothetical protein
VILAILQSAQQGGLEGNKLVSTYWSLLMSVDFTDHVGMKSNPISKRSIASVLGFVGKESLEKLQEREGWKFCELGEVEALSERELIFN